MADAPVATIAFVANGPSDMSVAESLASSVAVGTRQVRVMVAVDPADDQTNELAAVASAANPALDVLPTPTTVTADAWNACLESCTTPWIAIMSPSDKDPGTYVDAVAPVLREAAEAVLVAPATSLSEPRSERSRGTSISTLFVDLLDDPHLFPRGFEGSFLRRDVITGAGRRVDARIRPHFAGLHFVAAYLASAPTPTVIMVHGTGYEPTASADENSPDRMSDVGHYTAVLEFGYLDLLTPGPSTADAAMWIQYLVLGELATYFAEEERVAGATSALTEAVAERFHELIADIVSHLSAEAVATYSFGTMKAIWRELVRHGWSDEKWHTPYAVVGGVDRASNLVRLRYWFRGRPPAETIRLSGVRTTPVHAKQRAWNYFNRTLLYERIAWIPIDGDLTIDIDGRRVPIRYGWPEAARLHLSTQEMRARFALPSGQPVRPRSVPERPAPGPSEAQQARPPNDPDPQSRSLPLRRSALRRVLRRDLPPTASRPTSPPARDFTDSWVFVDRYTDAADNAEALFEYVRTHRPDINAWFVLLDTSPDWARLSKTRLGDRLVAYDSELWRRLMAQCTVLVSSHADKAVLDASLAPQARRVSLGHGVRQRDQSTWLNARNLDLIVVSTVPEYDSLVGDGTAFIYTSKEVARTELPRFDRLLSTADREEPNLLLLAPTWREWLATPVSAATHRRSVTEDFASTEFWQMWRGLLSSTAVEDAARRRGLTVAFMPHPNLRDLAAMVDLPANTRYIDGPRYPVFRALAQTALLITDYSSVAFDMAYLRRPSLYFQFDRQRIERGHIGRSGYFDYARDGFGPVATDLATAEDLIPRLAEVAPNMIEPFATRAQSAFTFRDGQACARVMQAIESGLHPQRGT